MEQNRGSAPGIAELLRAMGNASCDADAIGDSVKPDGECLFRTVSCEGMVHWPTTVFAELVWEHVSRFARDTETGKLIRL